MKCGGLHMPKAVTHNPRIPGSSLQAKSILSFVFYTLWSKQKNATQVKTVHSWCSMQVCVEKWGLYLLKKNQTSNKATMFEPQLFKIQPHVKIERSQDDSQHKNARLHFISSQVKPMWCIMLTGARLCYGGGAVQFWATSVFSNACCCNEDHQKENWRNWPLYKNHRLPFPLYTHPFSIVSWQGWLTMATAADGCGWTSAPLQSLQPTIQCNITHFLLFLTFATQLCFLPALVVEMLQKM